jgi:hypothetical protein
MRDEESTSSNTEKHNVLHKYFSTHCQVDWPIPADTDGNMGSVNRKTPETHVVKMNRRKTTSRTAFRCVLGGQ